jgi:undecaprenyl-diphosphatase
MGWGASVGLGVIQGLTEFLPVSSSGHLILLKTWLGLAAPGIVLETGVHLGTLVAVVVAYRQNLGLWVRQLAQGRRDAWRLFALVGVGSVPAAIAGIWAGDWIIRYFTVPSVALGWALTSLLLWITPRPGVGQRTFSTLRWRDAWCIGLAQALALWPGLSRSGATIVMARSLGLNADAAAQFSFYLAIPAVIGATVFAWPALAHWPTSTLPFLAESMGVAAISGVIAIKWVRWMLRRRHAWHGFGVYTATMAIVAEISGGSH